MLSRIFQFIGSLIPYEEPVKSYILCFIFTVIFLSLVITIGYLVDRLEILQLRILNNFFGEKVASFVTNRVTFIGVFIHEMSHAIFASLMGAKVVEIKLMSFSKDGRLGWVTYQPRGNAFLRGLQNTACACAPVIVGLFVEITCFYLLTNGFVVSWFWKVFIIYLMISMMCHMSMSKQDIVNYLKGVWTFAIILYVILLFIRLGV